MGLRTMDLNREIHPPFLFQRKHVHESKMCVDSNQGGDLSSPDQQLYFSCSAQPHCPHPWVSPAQLENHRFDNCLERLNHFTFPPAYQWCMRAPISPLPCQHLLLLAFLIVTILVGAKQCLIVTWV